ncbi:hydantoinase B/oxoprolinase family protein [Hydrogenimonas sp. SS33]|uniref:hydantoinase B/oxoprolinase family protein n=1 Tax=Hydrogenimonas leucolamina TaxID=2954236 RepID=UPI00336C22D1
MSGETIQFAIDRGGTFTDLIARVGERFIVKKVLSQSPFYPEACSHAIGEVFRELGVEVRKIPVEKIGWVRMGTTIATNALLERKGEPVTLVVTEGFKDLLRIGDQSRPDLFALEIEKPEPLYEEIVEVPERVLWRRGRAEVEKAVDLPALQARLKNAKTKNIAICLKHAYAFDTHEKAVAEEAERRGMRTTCSHGVDPMPGYLARAQTTLCDAYLTPKLQHYLDTFRAAFDGNIAAKTLMMQSSGDLCAMAAFRGSRALLSGPAGGVTALASIYEGTPLIGFDMGGTSTDVCRYDGQVALRHESAVEGMRVRAPQVDLHTVASGGGSRLFLRDGLFVVGPESSGADPGPLCYGRRGFLSITDANLVTGRLDARLFPAIFGPGGDAPLDVAAAREGFEPIAKRLNQSIEAVAEGFLEVANEQMAAAIREITEKRGFDAASHRLCAFGGAGGQHAVAVAKKLGIRTVVIHRYAGILSAYGMALAKRRRDASMLVELPLKKLGIAAYEPLRERLEEEEPLAGALLDYLVTVRYEGAENRIEVPYKKAKAAFEEAYRRQFGFLMPERGLIAESVRLVATYETDGWARPTIAPQAGKPSPIHFQRLYLAGEWHDAPVYEMAALGSGAEIAGPALVMQETSTIVLEPGCRARVDGFGDLYIDVPRAKEPESGIDGVRLALMQNRFHFIAERMGQMLQKSAVSTNIKERLDFSCAIFDADGRLVSNAPHIPVHLGSMSSVVRALIEKFGTFEEGVSFITNAPHEGGSHLPDITVATPFVREGEVLFWVASRGHHADIGGKVPGSMPPFSATIGEEGALIEAFALVQEGRMAEEKVVALLQKAGARNIADNLSDLRAQLAANRAGLEGVLALMGQSGEESVRSYMAEILAVSENAMRRWLARRAGRYAFADRLDGGAEIRLAISVDDNGEALFDFTGTSPQLFGNQNTPPSVVRSAVLYALRAMLRRPLPLNDGLLAPVRLVLPEGSLLNPSADAAVVGGNVTTSQRIVDVVLGAFGEAAASQGCMNNVTFGNDAFGYYETIAGGAGATAQADGCDGVHTHMTNTRITDVEILERRYPVVVESFALRHGSGGMGAHAGGDSLIRHYRFLEPMAFAILSERRVFAPFGMAGGEPGEKGRNLLIREGVIRDLGAKARLQVFPGDVVRIETPGGGGYGPIRED